VVVDVKEAYIHCRKHIPRMQRLPRKREWGTDDLAHKGGDYFGARAEVDLCALIQTPHRPADRPRPAHARATDHDVWLPQELAADPIPERASEDPVGGLQAADDGRFDAPGVDAAVRPVSG
jgi:hypothetical protein